MTKEDINALLRHVKGIYPRFESVEKDGNVFRITSGTTESWFTEIGWMSLNDAMKIFDQHMNSEKGDKTPTIRTWIKAAKAKENSGRCTATLDRSRNVIVWQPEEGGKVYEKPVKYNERKGLWETDDGYLYGLPE